MYMYGDAKRKILKICRNVYGRMCKNCQMSMPRTFLKDITSFFN